MTEALTTIELVRHAKAQSRDRWWGRPDRERPLTRSGRAQARSLAADLADPRVVRIISSPFQRCVQTVQPLAGKLGLTVETDDALGEAATVPVLDGRDAWVASAWLGGRAFALLERLVRECAGQSAVLCSHGDVIPAVMATLVGRDGLQISDVRCRTGGRFRLTFTGLACTATKSFPPP